MTDAEASEGNGGAESGIAGINFEKGSISATPGLPLHAEELRERSGSLPSTYCPFTYVEAFLPAIRPELMAKAEARPEAALMQ